MSEVHAPVVEYGVGRRLKQCREAQMLTIQDVSAQMHLEPRIIEALETDDYSGLPGPLYVRGYLRGYAKVLKIDAVPLLAQFESGSVPDTPEIVPEVKHPTQTSSSDKPVKFLTYFISLTLVVLLIIWWQSKFVVPASEQGAAPAQAQQQAEKNPLGYPIKIVHHPDVPSYRAPGQETGAAATGGVSAAANPASTATAPGTAATTVAAGNSSSGDTAAGPSTGAQPPSNVIVAGPGGPDHIVIHVTADSWIEIFDANETRIYRNLARTGDILKLSGNAPFSVLLGFAQGVTLEFNGKSFDPAPYSHAGVARFTLRNHK